MITVSKLAGKPRKKPTMLRQLREKYGLTLREVSTASGVSPATVNRVENGRECDVRTALRLARFYETTVEILFGDFLHAREASRK